MPRVGKYVFPSDHAEEHQPFRPNALTNCIKRCGFNATMHGCRTTFRNWGADNKEHNFRREVLEFCLSHRVGDESELSYWGQRNDRAAAPRSAGVGRLRQAEEARQQGQEAIAQAGRLSRGGAPAFTRGCGIRSTLGPAD